jgi:hypothetical protein
MRNNIEDHFFQYVSARVSQSEISFSAKEFELFKIAIKMKKSGLSDIFIVSAVKTALSFDGVADLIDLWNKEKDQKEREEIVADIQDMIDECLKCFWWSKKFFKATALLCSVSLAPYSKVTECFFFSLRITSSSSFFSSSFNSSA